MPKDADLPQFAFRDGVLEIATRLSTMRIRWSPEPAAEQRGIAMRNWRPFCPEFRLLRPADPGDAADREPGEAPSDTPDGDPEEARQAAFEAFRGQLPAHVVRLAERFGSHQWLLMQLLALKPEAVDLAEHNPVLAYCLANNPEFRDGLHETAVWHAATTCPLKQRDILAWLGFPPREAVVRLFRRLRPAVASPPALRALRVALLEADDQVLALLNHQPTIQAGLLELVTHPKLRGMVTPSLLREVANNPADQEAAGTADRLLTAMALLREARQEKALPVLASLDRVQAFVEACERAFRQHLAELARQEELRQEAARRREAQRRRQAAARRRQRRDALTVEAQRQAEWLRRPPPLPPPPVPGEAGIEPLTDLAALVAEGQEQSNCVGGYGPLVMTGRIYVYRVLSPARATLSICCGPDGFWRRSELSGRGNREPPREVVRHVDAWLRRQSHSV